MQAKTLHEIVAIVNEWRRIFHMNREGDIIFQNKRTLANVSFSDNALHKIERHSRGFELIPTTIENPDEIWGMWENKKQQKVVLRNYIKFSTLPFIVQTRDGVVINAFVVSPKSANKFRKGVIL